MEYCVAPQSLEFSYQIRHNTGYTRKTRYSPRHYIEYFVRSRGRPWRLWERCESFGSVMIALTLYR